MEKSIIQWNGEAECLTAEIDAAAFVGQDIAIQREIIAASAGTDGRSAEKISGLFILGRSGHCFTGMQEKKADLPYGLRAERHRNRTVSVVTEKRHIKSKQMLAARGLTRRIETE